MRDRKDFFGKYSSKLIEIHDDLLTQLKFDGDIKNENIERILIQCNYSEYIEHHPEEPEYFFDILDFNFQDHPGQL